MGKAAFLEPAAATDPCSADPPSTRKQSTQGVCRAATADSSAGRIQIPGSRNAG